MLIASVSVLFVGIVGYFVFDSIEPIGKKRLVTFYDRGKQVVVLTRANTVKGALTRADIKLNPRDTTEPSLSSELSSAQNDVIIYRSRLVAIDDQGIRQSVVTVAQSPNAILKDAKLTSLENEDKTSFKQADLSSDRATVLLSVERMKKEEKPPVEQKVEFKPLPNALTASKGAHVFVDSIGVAHRETYYDLPMNRVIQACGVSSTYSIRSDGAKVDQDGYVLIAANLRSYPRCSVVETSLGPGKVYDTGGFAVKHPYGFDLATDWSNYNGT